MNGLSALQAEELHRELDPTLAGPPEHFGGEVYVFRSETIAPVLARAEDAFRVAVQRQGRPKFTTEEHLFNHALRRSNVSRLDDRVRRIWTAPRLRELGPAPEQLVMWHLPAEKDRGFPRLHAAVEDRSSWFWTAGPEEYRSQLGSYFGIPRRRMMRWDCGGSTPVVLTLIARETLSMPAVRRLLGTEGSESVLIVGTAENASRTVRELHELPQLHLVGVCLSASEAARTEVEGVPVLGAVSDASALAASMPIDIVAVHDVDKLGGLQLARFNWGLETTGTQISIVTPLTNTACERLTVRQLGRRLVLDVQHSKPSGLIAQLKHAVERLLAGLILISTLPVIVLAALAVQITSPGSAIFKQIRVREYGSTFTMYKLRTMFLGAEARLPELMEHNEVGGGLFKLKADPRVTRVGRWLRMLSIDELPQLVNVLKGDMSLIGPRPALPHEVATYDEQALRRLAVKPGLTGLWQVSGRSNLSWDDSVRLDTDYVDNWRAARDVSIAIRTIKVILRREGAR